jgi:uncharacterized protein
MSANNRIPALDSLRGIALFGILVVNAPFFFYPEGVFGTYALQNFPGLINRAAEFVTTWLFDGKFILIFSFLFGWGLHSLMQGEGYGPRYLRRLLGLLIIGVLHGIFLFVGDILVTYAILGMPFYWMRNWPVKKLITAATCFFALSVVTQGALGYLILQFPVELADYSANLNLHRTGSFGAITAHRIEELLFLWLATPLLFAPQVLGMFLLGLAAAKHFAEDPTLERAKPLARRLVTWLLFPALALNALYAVANNTLIFNAAIAFTMRGAFVPLLTLAYLSAALLLLTNPRWNRIAQIFGGDGRISLSVYIGESVVMGFIALSYGLALYGTLSPSVLLLLCAIVYAVLLALGSLWLRHFKLGPLEWILRSITEARVVSIK